MPTVAQHCPTCGYRHLVATRRRIPWADELHDQARPEWWPLGEPIRADGYVLQRFMTIDHKGLPERAGWFCQRPDSPEPEVYWRE